MDASLFRATTGQPAPPDGLNPILLALWWEAKGDWPRAHEYAQNEATASGAAVHAYLHRVEGDLANARYWYQRAGRGPESGALGDEWAALVQEFS